MAAIATSVRETCERARQAALLLAQAPTEQKNAGLEGVVSRLGQSTAAILEANAADVEAVRSAGLDDAFIDRLMLSEERIEAMAQGVREVIALADPIGEEIENQTLASGLEMSKVRVPIGVVALVYEARPNVTIDAAALCLKSGNAVVLRGSSAAQRSNAVLASIVDEACGEAGLPEGSVGFITTGEHDDLRELATQSDLVDLIIPRGGDGLKDALKDVATVPVIYAAAGNCHVYVHSDADQEMARAIVHNAKVQRPGVCNAAETLLVSADVADEFLPSMLADLHGAGVELVGDDRARAASGGVEVGEATADDWDTEYHRLKLAVGVVDSLEDAIDHVNEHGTGHSEAIVTGSKETGAQFTNGVDAAAVYVNASTRFTDGFEFGMGGEMGNSTQKLHARGPIGLRELTSTKYVGHGTGQVRK